MAARSAQARVSGSIAGQPRLDRREYGALVPNLRFALLDFQQQLREARIPTVVIVAGADGVKSDTINALHTWFDPRGVDTHTFGPGDTTNLDRPLYALYAGSLPAKGRIGLYFGSWYTRVAAGRMDRSMGGKEAHTELERIAAFERSLVADGFLVIKIWLQLTRPEQRKRLAMLAGDPQSSWRVNKDDWRNLDHNERFAGVFQAFRERTTLPGAPWHVISAADDRVRNVEVARLFVEQATQRLLEQAVEAEAEDDAPVLLPVQLAPLTASETPPILSAIDYDAEIHRLQARVGELARRANRQGRASVMVFEGWDAAGKGGTIRRVVEHLDARYYRVVPIAAPTPEEKAHHYLWRFWQHVPTDGHITVYDRSWYGRVLVERVEGFARPSEWMRAYEEINEFEAHLVSHGTVVTKFWLHLSPEEQLRRFRDREATPYKRHKITEEDWRNREKWPAYETAVNEMIARTSNPPGAPWVVVPAEDKRLARLVVLRTTCARLESALKR